MIVRAYRPEDAEACAPVYNERYRVDVRPGGRPLAPPCALDPDSFHDEVADGRTLAVIGADHDPIFWNLSGFL